jgi:5-methylcytosine-specific restriction endonuclease McrA
MSYSTRYRELRKAILKRDDYTCAYCGQTATTVDHIIPISKGGVDHESNLTSACATCNYGKKDRDAKTFLEKKYAERFTKIKNKNDFFAHDATRTHSLVALSPRDFGVFEPPLFEEKRTG